jgi:hypothetical protein
MPSTLRREAAVISAVEQLVELEDFQSITVMRRDSCGDYSAVLVTPSLDIYGMTLKVSSEGEITYASPLRIL